jgi:hypothetical protein
MNRIRISNRCGIRYMINFGITEPRHPSFAKAAEDKYGDDGANHEPPLLLAKQERGLNIFGFQDNEKSAG